MATVVLVHGLWLTPLSWEHWKARFEAAGHVVHAPAWPGMEGPIEQVRADAAPYARLGVTEVADHYDAFVRGLDAPPIVIGHSFGGLIAQILLDRGLGAAGVAIHPAPPRGVLSLPPSALRVASVALRNPANLRRAVPLTAKQFHYGFGNTLSVEDSERAWQRYAVPGPGRPLFQAATANLNPRAATRVDYRNGGRAPLLLIAGGADHTVPAAMTRENFRRQRRSGAVTELEEHPERSHFTCGEPGWETVADHALAWAVAHAR
ncbi:MAG TPA: alpha/beta fold hydrolase [Solirubrobacteraceae bacterium]|jgi:alpha-beta hydrolase superfamily lysophospholipase|nr:alpha/beta fold hydrolase [Solirubrobacteraceae bacterium]